MPNNIFISYRRDDSRHAAGRLVDRLGQTFARDQLFMDVDNIELGLDFVKELSRKVEACEIMLVIIGPSWLEARDTEGRRRLDNPKDFVRIEIETALKRDIRVIPVFLDGAPIVNPEDLPSSLAPLVNRQATRITHEQFGRDADKLVESLLRIMKSQSKQKLHLLNASFDKIDLHQNTSSTQTENVIFTPYKHQIDIAVKIYSKLQNIFISATKSHWFAAFSPLIFGILLILIIITFSLDKSFFKFFSFLEGSTTAFLIPFTLAIATWVLVFRKTKILKPKPLAIGFCLLAINLFLVSLLK